jgi:hypothetical protein
MLRVFKSVRLKALSVNSGDVAFFLRMVIRCFCRDDGYNSSSVDALPHKE